MVGEGGEKSPLLGVARIVLRDIFLASIFVAYMEPKLFFLFRAGKISSAAPIKVESSSKRYGASLGGSKTLKTLHFESFFNVQFQ
jgi:hypothetical protein